MMLRGTVRRKEEETESKGGAKVWTSSTLRQGVLRGVIGDVRAGLPRSTVEPIATSHPLLPSAWRSGAQQRRRRLVQPSLHQVRRSPRKQSCSDLAA